MARKHKHIKIKALSVIHKPVHVDHSHKRGAIVAARPGPDRPVLGYNNFYNLDLTNPLTLPSTHLQEVEDARQYHPERIIRFKTVFGSSAVSNPAFSRNFNFSGTELFNRVFRFPQSVVVCIRRSARRSSLFAFGRIGKGKRVPARRHRFNASSAFHCYKVS